MTRQSLLVLELQQRVNMLRLQCFQCFVKTEADIFNYRHRRSLRLCHMPTWLFVTYDVWEFHLFFSPSVRPVGESTERWQSVVAPPNTHAHWHTRTHLQLGLVCFVLCSVAFYHNIENVCAAHGFDYHFTRGRGAFTSRAVLCVSFNVSLWRFNVSHDVKPWLARCKKKKMDWLKWQQWNWEFNINSDAPMLVSL